MRMRDAPEYLYYFRYIPVYYIPVPPWEKNMHCTYWDIRYVNIVAQKKNTYTFTYLGDPIHFLQKNNQNTGIILYFTIFFLLYCL